VRSEGEPRGPRESARGRLRLFFGGSAGLTAVCAMLETARAAQRAGGDVVIGLMSHRGREALSALTDRFESLPIRRTTAGDVLEARIDLDAARKRAPSILLVDTHVADPASHQPWADIESLMADGLDVWAAVDASGFSSWIDLARVPHKRTGLSLL
jgi:two-component system sensor histidine kinase KdpD